MLKEGTLKVEDILIGFAAIIAALKATSLHSKKNKLILNIFNFALGVFCGVLMGHYMEPQIGVYGAALSAFFLSVIVTLTIDTLAVVVPALFGLILNNKITKMLGIKHDGN